MTGGAESISAPAPRSIYPWISALFALLFSGIRMNLSVIIKSKSHPERYERPNRRFPLFLRNMSGPYQRRKGQNAHLAKHTGSGMSLDAGDSPKIKKDVLPQSRSDRAPA